MIKPCPFCESTDVATSNNGHTIQMICYGCGATVSFYNVKFDREELIKNWNNRK